MKKYALGLDLRHQLLPLPARRSRATARSSARRLPLPQRRARHHHRSRRPERRPPEPAGLPRRPRGHRSPAPSPRRKQRIPISIPENIIGIGVDTTGSTPIPVDEDGTPLALPPEFPGQPQRHGLAVEGPHRPRRGREDHRNRRPQIRPHYLAKCGGTYSSEWFWRKILPPQEHRPRRLRRRHSASSSTATTSPPSSPATPTPHQVMRGVCAAGHKAMYCDDWGGLPDKEFLARTRPRPRRPARPPLRQGPHRRPARRARSARMGAEARPPRPASPSPSAPSTPTWARSAPASTRAPWSRSSAPAPAT